MKTSPRPSAFLLAILGLLAPTVAVPSVRSEEAPPVVVLFVGNSYTFGGLTEVNNYNKESVTNEPPGKPGQYGGVPGIFKKLTDEAGLHYDVHMEVAGGKPLEYHLKTALPTIAQAKWNVVVLQGFSTEPIPAARGGMQDEFVGNAALLEQAIHRANPAAKVYLYETFPRSDQVYPDKGPYHDATVNTMATDLHDGCERAFKQDGHFEAVVPAGDAWVKVFAAGLAQLNPYGAPEPGKFNIWAKDNHHASAYGSYLNALVFFEKITGKDSTTLGANEQAAHDLGIPPEVAAKLQQIANETVKTAHPVVPR